MLARQQRPDPPRYIIDDMVEDVLDRLSFLRVVPRRALVIGDWLGTLDAALAVNGAEVRRLEPADGFDEERPFASSEYDFIASLGTLDTVNDLPGALIHLRTALEPGGLVIASLAGAGSLPELRAAMAVADGDRPAPRIHPQVDVRAGGQLMQRAGFTDPVVDSRSLDVSYGSLDRLIGDLRAMGMNAVLDRHGPPLGKHALASARAAFAAAGKGGRTVERFEILTLSGWRQK